MTRGGFVLTSLGFVGLAAAGALAMVLLQPPQPALGPVPPEALALPGDASFVVGLDVKKLVASPFYKRQAGTNAQARLDAFKELQEKTGLDPERDVDAIVFTGAPGAGSRSGAAVVLGAFDEARLRKVVEARPGVTQGQHEGVPLYSYGEGDTMRSLAILGRRALVLGQDRTVRTTLQNRSRGSAATFWMVGDQSVLRDLPKAVPGPGTGGSGGSLTLPALKQVVVAGDFEPQLAFDVTGDTVDEAGAKGLADMLRGFIAIATMQASQKPELAGLASAFNVSQAGAQVTLTVRIPTELLDAIQKSASPPAVTQ
jgi:hypothetical protein